MSDLLSLNRKEQCDWLNLPWLPWPIEKQIEITLMAYLHVKFQGMILL
jgi:hypothetical protein